MQHHAGDCLEADIIHHKFCEEARDYTRSLRETLGYPSGCSADSE